MSVQTVVNFTPALSIPGTPKGSDYASRTRAAEVVSNNGLAMCKGTTDTQCKLPTSAGEVAQLYGVARENVARDPNFPAGGTAGYLYQVGDSVELIYRGPIYVITESDVVQFGPVYVRHTSDGASNTQRGSFRGDADTGPFPGYVDRAALVTGARYLTTTAAGGLAELDLNLPQ